MSDTAPDRAGHGGEGHLVPMHLAKLVAHAKTAEPLAILLEADRDRCLVVSVRAPQAEVMARGAVPRRDTVGGTGDERVTQDLVADLAAALHRRLAGVEITDLVDDRFRSDLVLDDGTRVAVRPSDALALAVRDELPILVAEPVLGAVGQSFAELWGDRPPPPHEQVLRLRRQLDDATADDFRTGGATGPDGG